MIRQRNRRKIVGQMKKQDKTSKGTVMGELVTIAEVESYQAGVLQAVLEGHGISVYVENANTSAMLPHLRIPTKIQVEREQAERAVEILQALPDAEGAEGVEGDED